MEKFRLLKLNEVVGQDKLSVFNTVDISADITDFAIASGTFSFVNEDDLTTGMYWVDDIENEKKRSAYVVDINGNIGETLKQEKNVVGIRVAVKYSDIKDSIISETFLDDNLSIIQYGNYPKDIVEEFTYAEFLKLRNNGKVKETNAVCVLPRRNDGTFSRFGVVQKNVLQYNKINFVEYSMEHLMCSINDKRYYKGSPILFKVEPINWLVDKEKDIAITEDVIVGGIPYSSSTNVYARNEDINDYLEFFEISLNNTDNIKTKKKKIGK